jgi:hypothetical protein
MAGILKVDQIQSDSNLSFAIGSSNVAYFNTTSGLVLNNSTIQANGIKFPATQVPSIDANTLDDYEEGTWTPDIPAITSWSSKSTYGWYQKVGRWVSAHCNIYGSATSGSGGMTITGLPFAQDPTIYTWNSTDSSSRSITSVGTIWHEPTNLGTGYTQLIAYIGGGTSVQIYKMGTGGNYQDTQTTYAEIAAASNIEIRLAITYMTAA